MSNQLSPEELARMKANADEMQDAWAKNYFSDYRDEYAETAKDDIPALLNHIEARELAFQKALQGLLHLPTREELTGEPSSYDGESRWEAVADYQKIVRAAAASLHITLE